MDTLRTFLGSFFDHEVKIADRVTRDSAKPVLTRSIGRNAFTGKLMILVDSASASASEVLARVVQLEKRGTVLGDRSAGAVMESKRYQYLLSFHHRRRPAHDGKSLERVGVTPDEVIQPTAADLTAGRDPVLARAVEIVGGRMSPERAGALFPYEWPKQ